MQRFRIALLLVLPLLAGRCALYNEVVIAPLFLLPENTYRLATNPKELLEAGDYTRVIAMSKDLDTKPKVSARELATLGSAELAAGRFDDARRHLRRALDLRPVRTEIAQIAWDLSQTEYLCNNYDAAYEWAVMADRNGLQIRKWHLDYLSALANVEVYRVEGERSSRVRMNVRNPTIPRITVDLLGREVTAVIDSGAVLSIMSVSLANQMSLERLPNIQGLFYGLLGEPINVSFSVIDSLKIGNTIVRQVPVAIMPDEKLNFVVMNRQPFKMDFLLGANLLKEFRLEFNYGDGTIVFDALTSAEKIPAENQNMFFVGFRPFVHSTINRRGWYPFVLDTGSEITFLNEEQIASTVLRNFPKLHGATLQGLGGARKMGSKVEDVEVGVDRWAGKFRNIPLYTTEHSTAFGIVGQDFLKNFRVVMDFGRMRLDLNRPSLLRRTSSR